MFSCPKRLRGGSDLSMSTIFFNHYALPPFLYGMRPVNSTHYSLVLRKHGSIGLALASSMGLSAETWPRRKASA